MSLHVNMQQIIYLVISKAQFENVFKNHMTLAWSQIFMLRISHCHQILICIDESDKTVLLLSLIFTKKNLFANSCKKASIFNWCPIDTNALSLAQWVRLHQILQSNLMRNYHWGSSRTIFLRFALAITYSSWNIISFLQEIFLKMVIQLDAPWLKNVSFSK